MSMQPAPWPEPDPQIAAAIKAMYGSRKTERPLAVEVRDRLGQWLADEDFAAAFGAFFEAILVENMDLGRPENVELLFRRGQRAGRPPPARRPAAGSGPPSTGTATWSPSTCSTRTPG